MMRAFNEKMKNFFPKWLLPLLLVFIFVQTSNLEAAGSPKEYDEVVSLGQACQVAYQTKLNGFRTNAYPFDVLITPFEGLIKFINYKGANFLDRDKLVVLQVLQGGVLSVLDLNYNINLIHDFMANFSNYDHVKEKYERRTKRFFDLLESKKRVLFIRVNLTYDQAVFLDHLLQTNYPKLSYTLVAINDSEQSKSDWGLERVRNFYMKQSPANWAGDHGRWKEILSQFKLSPLAKPNPAE